MSGARAHPVPRLQTQRLQASRKLRHLGMQLPAAPPGSPLTYAVLRRTCTTAHRSQAPMTARYRAQAPLDSRQFPLKATPVCQLRAGFPVRVNHSERLLVLLGKRAPPAQVLYTVRKLPHSKAEPDQDMQDTLRHSRASACWACDKSRTCAARFRRPACPAERSCPPAAWSPEQLLASAWAEAGKGKR